MLFSLAISEVGAFLLFSAGVLTDPSFSRFPPRSIWLLFGFSAFVIALGGYAAISQVLAAKRTASASLLLMPAAHELHPVGIPGTVPLHELCGKIIGAVKPLTTSLPEN